MSSSGHDRYYGNLSKSRRSSPGEHQHHSSVFSTGQGGRTVLPPLLSAFPTSRFPGLLFRVVSKATLNLLASHCVQPDLLAISTHNLVRLQRDMS
jgi:hypothetical protein